jgi:hypothetical protein
MSLVYASKSTAGRKVQAVAAIEPTSWTKSIHERHHRMQISPSNQLTNV